MIRIRQIKIDINRDNIDNILNNVSKRLRINREDIIEYNIKDKSLDARRKPDLYFIYTIDIKVDNEDKILSIIKDNDVLHVEKEEYKFVTKGNLKLNKRPVIIGAGPAGLFCAYILAENGYKPILYERGKKVEDRVKDVEEFFNTGVLNIESNVQFGEGGAGTFSDGKLVSQVKDINCRKKKVFDTFIECGANKEIGYVNKPHIGTDVLRNVIINMRNKILSMGGNIYYDSCLTDIEIINNKISKIRINENWIETEILVLALGHSARDTFKMLYDKKLNMEPKSFAVGIRIQHPQELININQYGNNYPEYLGAASYKLTYKASNGRGVYSFCMCPGGYVVNASSENNMLAVNGMSNNARESENANSALIVTVTPKDYGEHPLDGIEYQRNLERKAYELGKSKIPVQLYKDYKDNIVSTNFKSINPIFKGNYEFANINEILPSYINESLKEAIEYFSSKIKKYNNDDCILAAVESRTSSPIRIIRDENLISNVEGIYPIGEGAGYAGGITSASIDGIKCAEAIATIYGGINE